MNIKDLREALDYTGAKENPLKCLFSEAKDQNNWKKMKNTPLQKEMIEEVLAESVKFLRQPIKVLHYSTFRAVLETGKTLEYQKDYFERRSRLNTFAILSLIFGKQEYIHALEDIIWAVCGEYTWALPQHLDSYGKKRSLESEIAGGIQVTARETKKDIDLFSAETGFALAEILHLLEDKIDPLIISSARQEIMERILYPYCEINTQFCWEICTNNWAAVCAGSIGAAAMYLIKDGSILAPILHKVLATMDCFLKGYEEDGACTEGLGYWYYGFGFYVYFAKLLKQRTAGSIDLLQHEKVPQIALFQQKCVLSEDNVINFSDTVGKFKFYPGLLHYLKNRFPDVLIPTLDFRAKFADDHCARWASAIRNLVWINVAYKDNEPVSATYYLDNAQWFISKYVQKCGKDTVCFVAKGGHNAVSHNHNDVGQFIFDINGEVLLGDVGAGEYTIDYFSEKRYTYFCNGSQGHSVPIVEGCYQQSGREYTAKILDVLRTEEQDVFSMDIAKAYKNDNMKSLVRSFVFEKKEKIQLMLCDTYEFSGIPASITERFISLSSVKPEFYEEDKLFIQGNKGGIVISYDAKKQKPDIERVEYNNHMGCMTAVYVINFHLKKEFLKSKVRLQYMFDVTYF